MARTCISQLTKKRWKNVGTTLCFGCENVLIQRSGELYWKVFSMSAKRFSTTLQKTFLQPFESLSKTATTFKCLTCRQPQEISVLIQMFYF